MDNKKFLDNRWKITEQTLKKYHKDIVEIYKSVSYELLDLFKYLELNPNNLNKKVPDRIKNKLINKIAYWKRNNLNQGYFDYLIKSTKNYTYANVLMLMIYGIYAEKQQIVLNKSQHIFKIVAKDSYKQGYTDLFKKSPLSYETLT